MTDEPDLRDGLTDRLRALGSRPVDPALASAHLTAMASLRPVRRGRQRLAVAGAFLAGSLIGSTGLAAAGALPAPVQDVAHTALAKVNVDVPRGTERHDGPECVGDGPARNRGHYLKQERAKGPEALAAAKLTRCGMPVHADADADADADAGTEADKARNGGKGAGAKGRDKARAGDTGTAGGGTGTDQPHDGGAKGGGRPAGKAPGAAEGGAPATGGRPQSAGRTDCVDRGQGNAGGQGRANQPTEPGRPREPGQPAVTGKPGDTGRPDTTGKPECTEPEGGSGASAGPAPEAGGEERARSGGAPSRSKAKPRQAGQPAP